MSTASKAGLCLAKLHFPHAFTRAGFTRIRSSPFYTEQRCLDLGLDQLGSSHCQHNGIHKHAVASSTATTCICRHRLSGRQQMFALHLAHPRLGGDEADYHQWVASCTHVHSVRPLVTRSMLFRLGSKRASGRSFAPVPMSPPRGFGRPILAGLPGVPFEAS